MILIIIVNTPDIRNLIAFWDRSACCKTNTTKCIKVECLPMSGTAPNVFSLTICSLLWDEPSPESDEDNWIRQYCSLRTDQMICPPAVLALPLFQARVLDLMKRSPHSHPPNILIILTSGEVDVLGRALNSFNPIKYLINDALRSKTTQQHKQKAFQT